MAPVQIQHDPTLVHIVNGQVEGDNGASKGAASDNTSQTPDQMMLDVLRKYEKLKAAVAEALIQNSNEESKSQLKGSDLDKALGHLPEWKAIMNLANNSTEKGHEYMPDLNGNVFMEICKFLREHRDSDAKLQVAQAMNMVAQESMLDTITKESTASLDHMKTQISDAEKAANSPLAQFLKIGLPILLAVVTIVVTVATMGTATPATALIDAAATAAAETGVEAGVVTGVEEGVQAAVEEGLVQGAEQGAGAATQETVVNQVSTNVGKQLTKEVLKDTIKTATEEAVSSAAKGATKEAVQEAVKQSVKESVQDLVKNAVEASVRNAAAEFGEQATSETAQTAIKQAVTESVGKTLAETTSKTLLQRAGAFVVNGIGRGGAAAVGLTAISAPVCQLEVGKPDADKAETEQNATTIAQAEMSINSSASESIQTGLKQAMSYEQNAQSEEESDSSSLNQIMQAMIKVMYLGNY